MNNYVYVATLKLPDERVAVNLHKVPASSGDLVEFSHPKKKERLQGTVMVADYICTDSTVYGMLNSLNKAGILDTVTAVYYRQEFRHEDT